MSRRWWEKTGIELKEACKKAAAAAAELETEADLDSELEDDPEGAAGVIGEEESQGAIGSSGAVWSGLERNGAEWSGVEQIGAEWS